MEMFDTSNDERQARIAAAEKAVVEAARAMAFAYRLGYGARAASDVVLAAVDALAAVKGA